VELADGVIEAAQGRRARAPMHGAITHDTVRAFALVLCVRGNRIIHRASLVLRAEDMWQKYKPFFVEVCVNQSFPFSPLQCRQGRARMGQELLAFRRFTFLKRWVYINLELFKRCAITSFENCLTVASLAERPIDPEFPKCFRTLVVKIEKTNSNSTRDFSRRINFTRVDPFVWSTLVVKIKKTESTPIILKRITDPRS